MEYKIQKGKHLRKDVFSISSFQLDFYPSARRCIVTIFCMDVCGLTEGHILGQISTKLGMMDSCRMGMVTVSGRHSLVITAAVG